jgi:hypothetical protein
MFSSRLSGKFWAGPTQHFGWKSSERGEVNPLDITVTRELILSRAVALEVRVEDGKLVVASIGQWPILDFDKDKPVVITAMSGDEFQVEGGDHTRIAFVRDAAGKVSGAILNPGPWQQSGVMIR